jgi:DNA-directed RNA polymerase
MVERDISSTAVVADRVLASSEEASDIIKLLSKSAVALNHPRILAELGQAEFLGSHVPDPLEGVPEVKPVVRLAVRIAFFHSHLAHISPDTL